LQTHLLVFIKYNHIIKLYLSKYEMKYFFFLWKILQKFHAHHNIQHMYTYFIRHRNIRKSNYHFYVKLPNFICQSQIDLSIVRHWLLTFWSFIWNVLFYFLKKETWLESYIWSKLFFMVIENPFSTNWPTLRRLHFLLSINNTFSISATLFLSLLITISSTPCFICLYQD